MIKVALTIAVAVAIFYFKEAVCMHLLGYSNIHELNLCGVEYSKEPDTFATKMKKGAPKKTNRYDQINNAY